MRPYPRAWAQKPLIDSRSKQARIDKLRKQREHIRYKEYLKEVSTLNQKKAFLSTYRGQIDPETKAELVREIQKMTARLEAEEKDLMA